MLEEEALTDDTLYQAISSTYENRDAFIHQMEQSHLSNAVDTVIRLIEECIAH